MQSPKRRQHKHTKSRYQVKNWGKYEAGLRRRGDLTVWLSDEALEHEALPLGYQEIIKRYFEGIRPHRDELPEKE